MTICTHGRRRSPALPVWPAILALAALWPTTVCGAASALGVRYGSQPTFLSPEIAAMGGTGVAVYRGGISSLLNPAFLVEEQAVRADLAGALAEVHEDRYQPLFDTFESYVNETAIATNRHSFWSGGFGIAGAVPRAPLGLALGLSLTERYDFGYEFAEEVRNPSPFDVARRDELLEDREVTVEGALRVLSLGVGVAPLPFLSFGASLDYGFGNRDLFRGRRFYQTPDSSRTLHTEQEMDGVNFVLGTRVKVGDRLLVGWAVETPLTVDGDLDTTRTYYALEEAPPAVLVVQSGSGQVEVRYPVRWRWGLTFLPRNDPRTVVALEAEYARWSDLEDDRLPAGKPRPPLEDVLDVRLGVEHRFYNGVAARFGFRHLDEYADREAATSMFTGGLGLPAAGGELGFSVELMKMESIQGHWFPYPDEFGGEVYVVDDEARVETTQFRFGFGYTRAF